MLILGITGGHDAGWCLIKGGKILGAYEKERFTRKRHDGGEVVSLIKESLEKLNISIDDIDLVATSEPVHRNTESGLLKLSGERYRYPDEWVTQVVELYGKVLPCISVPHHLSHAAYARYTANFEEMAVITWDGGGDFYTEDAYSSTTVSRWNGSHLEWLKRIDNSDFGSLWFTYSEKIFSDGNAAGKLMGLAAYGSDRLVNSFRDRFFAPVQGILQAAFTIKNCWPDYVNPPFLLNDNSWTNKHIQDVAFAIQSITEEAGLSIAKKFASIVNTKNLGISGGVALNGYLNTRIVEEKLFDNVYVPPSVHDGGISVGCALFAYHHVLGFPWNPGINGNLAFIGNSYTTEQTLEALNKASNLKFSEIDLEEAEEKAAMLISQGKIVSWCAGRSEHGPRALGNRSILALPHVTTTRDTLNNHIKFRENFRPVAPVVLEEDVKTFFKMDWSSPYMMYIVNSRAGMRDVIPSALHVDGTARVQTVTNQTSLGRIVSELKKLTGIGCVLNTSFNIKTPIVETPFDAIEAFTQVPLDAMYVNGFWVKK